MASALVANWSDLPKPQVGVVVGIPTLGSHRMEFTMSLCSAGFPMNTVGQILPMVGRPVADARNLLADVAKKQAARYLIFLDEDVLFPPHAIRQLMWDLENNLHISVVAGIYPLKAEPPAPLVFKTPGGSSYYEWKVGDFFPVWATGMGCTIIRVADLQKMDDFVGTTVLEHYPQYGCFTEVKAYFKQGSAWLPEEVPGGGWDFVISEDIYFCHRANVAGLKVYCDAGIICSHIDGSGRVWQMNNSRPQVLPEIGVPKIYLDVGCGDMRRVWEDGVRFMRVDLDPDAHPDHIMDARKLNFTPNYADGLLLSHVLEHMSRHDAEMVLDEIVRVVKPGGWLCIAAPDMSDMLKMWNEGGYDSALRAIFGGQSNEYQYHKSGWDKATLEPAMARRGCVMTQYQKREDSPGAFWAWFTKGEKNLYAEEKLDTAPGDGNHANVQPPTDTTAGHGVSGGPEVQADPTRGGKRRGRKRLQPGDGAL